MNCDTAFDLITDRHGRQSAVLQEHLETCPRCRQMLETLAPALDELTDERTSLSEEFDGPAGMSGDWSHAERVASPEAVSVARQAAQRFSSDCATPDRRWSRLTRIAARYLAAFAVGACAAFVLLQRAGDEAHGKRPVAVPVADGRCTRQQCTPVTRELPDDAVQQIVLSCMICHVSSR